MSINIWGKYLTHRPEVLDTADTLKDAAYLMREYQLAFGRDWRVWVGRRKDGETTAPRVSPDNRSGFAWF